jgi:Integrase zinc binding domain/Integrase core domain
MHSLSDKYVLGRRSPIDGSIQIVVPVSLRDRLLLLAHYPPISAHPGGKRLYASLRRHYYWPRMVSDVYQVVAKCEQCLQERLALRSPHGNLTLFPAQEPLGYIAIDILGPLNKPKNGNQYLLVIVNRFSKLIRTVPLTRITASVVAWAFMEQWVYIYGPPLHLLSDKGRQFTSDVFKNCCKAMGLQHTFTSAYHPQANGQVKRLNRTILARLRALVGEEQITWDLIHLRSLTTTKPRSMLLRGTHPSISSSAGRLLRLIWPSPPIRFPFPICSQRSHQLSSSKSS